MHILHFGVVVTAPDFLTPSHAQDVLAQTLADAKGTALERLKAGAIDDQAVMLSHCEFLVTEESPAKRRLDWLLRNPRKWVDGDDRKGWLIFDAETGGTETYAAGRTAYAAIDAALARENT